MVRTFGQLEGKAGDGLAIQQIGDTRGAGIQFDWKSVGDPNSSRLSMGLDEEEGRNPENGGESHPDPGPRGSRSSERCQDSQLQAGFFGGALEPSTSGRLPDRLTRQGSF